MLLSWAPWRWGSASFQAAFCKSLSSREASINDNMHYIWGYLEFVDLFPKPPWEAVCIRLVLLIPLVGLWSGNKIRQATLLPLMSSRERLIFLKYEACFPLSKLNCLGQKGYKEEQLCADKPALWMKKPCFVVVINFRGINTPPMAVSSCQHSDVPEHSLEKRCTWMGLLCYPATCIAVLWRGKNGFISQVFLKGEEVAFVSHVSNFCRS